MSGGMAMKVRCLLAMFVFLFMPMGQVWSADDNLDHLKPLHFLIGDWVGQAVQPIDVPELEIEKGMDVRIQNSYKPMLNGNAIELTMSRSCDGKPLSTNREIMCWDPERKVVTHVIIGDGLYGNGVWKLGGEECVLDWEVTTSEDRVYKAKSRLKSVGRDEFTWQIVDFTINGESQSDGEVVHFKRAPQPLSPGQEKMKVFDFLIGEWESKTNDGKTSTHTYRWLNNQSFIEFRDGDYMEIMGWDPVKERYVSWCYGTHGGIALAVWKKKGDVWMTKCVPHFYDRHGFGIPSEFEMKIIDDETMEVSGRFGHSYISAKNTKVKSSE
jgi:hypothetical protein